MPARSPEAVEKRCVNANRRARERYHFDSVRKAWYQNWSFLRYYGITAEERDKMYEEQGGPCACCCEREATCVDHSHETRVVRSLLCHRCNIAVGFIEKDEVLKNILSYLARFRTIDYIAGYRMYYPAMN